VSIGRLTLAVAVGALLSIEAHAAR
jgi:hypothetical protein